LHNKPKLYKAAKIFHCIIFVINMHLIAKSKFFTTVVISMKKTRNRLLKLILKTIL